MAKFIENPTGAMSEEEEAVVLGYIKRSWSACPPVFGPEKYSDEELIAASIKHSSGGSYGPLQKIVGVYSSGRGFKALPEGVVRAVNEMTVGSHEALGELRAHANLPKFEEINAREIFTKSKDLRLLGTFMYFFPGETLRKNADLYAIILERDDVPERMKESLRNLLKAKGP